MSQPTKCPLCLRALNLIGSSLVCQTCHLQIWLQEEPYTPFIHGPPGPQWDARYEAAMARHDANVAATIVGKHPNPGQPVESTTSRHRGRSRL